MSYSIKFLDKHILSELVNASDNQTVSFEDNSFTIFDDNTGERIFNYDQGIFYL